MLHGNAYDLSRFVHPGGSEILAPLVGSDGTSAFEQHHSRDTLALAKPYLVGPVDLTDPRWTKEKEKVATTTTSSSSSSSSGALVSSKPSLSSMLTVEDFRAVAESTMPAGAWAYYESGGNTEATVRENERVFDRLWIRPRILIDVRRVDTTTRLLGSSSPSPLYVTATALARLADPRGEVAIVSACARTGTIYMLPTLSSCSLDEMTAAVVQGQTTWFQLYVNPDRSLTERVVARAEAKGCRALFVTVDAPQLGQRPRDMRHKASMKPHLQSTPSDSSSTTTPPQSTTRSLSSFIDAGLCWPICRGFSRFPVFLLP